MKIFAAAVVLPLALIAGAPIGAQSKSEWTASVVPAARCGLGERTESGLQGQTTAAERFSSRESQTYRCNLELVTQFEGEGANIEFTVFDNCGYFSTLGGPGQQHRGTVVVDISDRRRPQATAYLTSPAMLMVNETLEAHPGRKLLAAIEAGTAPAPYTQPSVFDLYDITDCRRPILKASLSVPAFKAHAGRFAHDGRTYYATSGTYNGPPLGEDGFVAIDVTDPAHPHVIYRWRMAPTEGVPPHDISISDDGTRAYVGIMGVPVAPAAKAEGRREANGIAILDISDIQRRRPNPQVRVLGKLFWNDGGAGQVPIPLKIKGRPYVISKDFWGPAGGRSESARLACAQGLPPFGFVRLIDVSDERHPTTVSKIMLQVHDPANCAQVITDVAATRSGYSTFICTPDDPQDTMLVACAMRESGLRVFDFRNPARPVEIAYYKPPARRTEARPGSGFSVQGGGPDRTSDSTVQVPRVDRKKNEIWFLSQDNGLQIVRFTSRFRAARPELFGFR